MRVTLMHNPNAGGGDLTRDDLVRMVVEAGHSITYQSTRERGYESALQKPGDVVLVAGGDGTVRKVAGLLLGRGIPMALLPLGTANNVSRSLDLSTSIQTAISRIATAPHRQFDAGIAKGAWGETHFLEGVGVGLFPVTMCLAESRSDNREARDDHHDRGITRDLRYLQAVLRRMPPKTWQIEADGKNLSGEYYLCEVMNIASIGPNLRLAPEADPADGRLDLVLVGESDRPRLRGYLADRVAGRDAELNLPTLRAERVTIMAAGAEVHIDDRLEHPHTKPSAMGGLVELTVGEGTVDFLLV
ncbi:MAG TPA: diacylglycerol kinase family protein [Gemmatimonadales bacterium]|jgi:diacylglycerol kinase family enzyme